MPFLKPRRRNQVTYICKLETWAQVWKFESCKAIPWSMTYFSSRKNAFCSNKLSTKLVLSLVEPSARWRSLTPKEILFMFILSQYSSWFLHTNWFLFVSPFPLPSSPPSFSGILFVSPLTMQSGVSLCKIIHLVVIYLCDYWFILFASFEINWICRHLMLAALNQSFINNSLMVGPTHLITNNVLCGVINLDLISHAKLRRISGTINNNQSQPISIAFN